ncbi:hypothetical protein A2U01_0041449, partial [Trifolium medium]|nr:hypothetical protein [Trifolium medium]
MVGDYGGVRWCSGWDWP